MFRWPVSLLILCFISTSALAQKDWPKQITLPNKGVVVIYEPQPESLKGITLHSRAAISLRTTPKADPVFGVIWSDAILNTDKASRTATLESIHITDAKFPDKLSDAQVDSLKALLEREIPKWTFNISLDDLTATIEQELHNNTDALNTAPPQIIYTTTPTTLVVLDGDPIVKKDEDLKMDRVINSPYLIVKNAGQYYLYGEQYWYRSGSVAAGWQPVTSLPAAIKTIDKQLKEQEAKAAADSNTVTKVKSPSAPAIIVSTTPAEIIQSKGSADFATVANTGLLYMRNSDDDVFLETATQLYYVLLSGRWYKGASLKGPWTFVPASDLPSDFSKIPEGSDKDPVLASVAGTPEAREALMDAEIPQTAKVDRQTATADVSYDGTPQFEAIQGTDLQSAVNTSATVLRSGNQYFCVENGVWFVANSPSGPWAVATTRPSDVDRIPPNNAAYNTRYVYVYDVTPEYVYMGYTPGYLNCYPFGPTVVYGTGYYYRPWIGSYYYPRPWTWGFGMRYNPWTGWSFGFGYTNGWFGMGLGWGGGFGGWWGPPAYRPPFRPWYGHQYGRRPIIMGNRTRNINNIRINNQHNNIYNRRNGIRPINNNFRPGNRLPGNNGPGNNRPGGGNNGRPDGNPGNNGRPGDNNTRPGGVRPGGSNLPGNNTRPGNPGDNNNGRPGGTLPGNNTRPGNPGDNNNGRPGGTLPGNNTRPGNPGDNNTRPGGTRPGGSTLPGNNTRPAPGVNPGDNTRPAPGVNPGNNTRPAPGVNPGNNTRPAISRPGTPNNVYSDPSGNVFQRDQSGNWQQRQQGQWQAPVNRPAVQQAENNRQQLNRAAERPRLNSAPVNARPSMPAMRPANNGGMNRGGGGGGARPAPAPHGGGTRR